MVESAGLAGVSRPWVGFGGGFADFDRDGRPDLFVVNGHVFYDAPDVSYRQPPQLFHNVDGSRFKEASSQGGPYFSVPHPARGAAGGDLDDDGSPDLAIVHQNEPATLLRNRRKTPHWVRFRLRGTQSNADAFGARVTVRAGERRWTQWLASGRGYLSQGDVRPLFALPSGEPVEATIVWPNGTNERFEALATNQTHELVEGSGEIAIP